MRKLFGVVVLFLAAVVSLPAAETDELVQKLKSKDTDERRAAARALGEMGAEAKPASEALLRALKDSDLFVRRFAAEALGKIGPEAKGAVPALTTLINSKSEKKEVLEAVVDALGKMGAMGVAALITV